MLEAFCNYGIISAWNMLPNTGFFKLGELKTVIAP